MAIRSSRDVIHPYTKNFIEKGGGYDNFTDKEIHAINFLVTNLIGKNLWNKFKTLYPFVGRSAAKHSINLINPNKHYIRWYGNVTHDSNGVTGNGGYGNTLFALGWLKETDIHLSVYNATPWTAANTSSNLIGVSTRVQKITLRNSSSRYTYSAGDGYFFSGNLVNDFIHIEAYGLIVGNNSTKCYVNGEQFGAISPNDPETYDPVGNSAGISALNAAKIKELDQYPILILSHDNFGTVSTISSTNIRFASIGYGFASDIEIKLFYKIVEEFQSILGRNVGSIKVSPKYFAFAEEESVQANISNIEVFLSNNRPFYNINNENIGATLSEFKVDVSGARRVSFAEKISSTVSIISFTEI